MLPVAGNNLGASQSGMQMGKPRYAADMKSADMLPASQGILHPQTGTVLFYYQIIDCKLKMCLPTVILFCIKKKCSFMDIFF